MVEEPSRSLLAVRIRSIAISTFPTTDCAATAYTFLFPGQSSSLGQSSHLDVHDMEPDLTALFAAAEKGDAAAREQLFERLYAELHRLARRELWKSGAAISMGATTLLHEAFINLSERETIAFPDRARFMAYAARAMRGLIIDHARSRHAQKRGGQFDITTLDTNISNETADQIDLPQVGDALDELAKLEPHLAQVVDLKFFCGFSFAEIAAMRGVSERTVQRDWEKARIYLHQSLREDPK
jgi:RNA polymerase sigma factor (TIGR02999 family)